MARIFLSAVTSELKPAREIAARVLRTLGYEPVYQDEFHAGAGDLRRFLRDLIDPCSAVIQLIGFCYGMEPGEAEPEYGRVSYTQYEAEYARRAGKKVYYLLLARGCVAAEVPGEEPVLAGLQLAYRAQVEAGSHLFHPASSLVELELKVHQLHNELRAFRERVERRQKRTLGLVILGVAVALLVAWWVWRLKSEQHEQGQALAGMDQKLGAMQEKLLTALRQAPERISQPAPAGLPGDEAARRAAAYAQLEKELALPAGTLDRELPTLATTLLARGDTSPLDRANALFIQKLYADAEQAAEASIQRSIVAGGQAVQDILSGHLLAGRSARAQAGHGGTKMHWERALEHFRAAAALTSRERDAAQWATVQHEIAYDLSSLARYDEAVPILREVVAERERVLGPEHADTLSSENNLAVILGRRGDYAGAEPIYRKVLAIKERTQGAEHPSTLVTMGNLAELLYAKGDRTGAEALVRKVFETNRRTLGEEAPATLIAANNLALMLESRGEGVESEKLFRQVLATRERKLGPEHPDTVTSANNLAALLRRKGNLVEAEALFRRVVAASERNLGPEHPDTLQRMNNFAGLLDAKGEAAEAEALYRKVLEGRERTLGKEHPDTLTSTNNLAGMLMDRGDLAGAETLYRRAVEVGERKLGAEHPNVLMWTNNLAFLLKHQGDLGAAEPLYRRVLAARERTLGASHPDTIASLNYLGELLSEKGEAAEAETLLRRAFAASGRVLGPEHPDTCLAAFNLGAFLEAHGHAEEAKPLAHQAYAGWLKSKGAKHGYTKEAVLLLRKLGEPVEGN